MGLTVGSAHGPVHGDAPRDPGRHRRVVDRSLRPNRRATKPLIWQSWIVFTAFAVAGYVLYRRGQWRRAAVCLAIYSVSGLISPLHYLSGALSEFDALQHVFILTDGLCGAAVLGLAIWLYAAKAPGRPDAFAELRSS